MATLIKCFELYLFTKLVYRAVEKIIFLIMHPLIIASYNCFTKIKLLPTILPTSTQVRWRKKTGGWRKPRWLPMAKSKIFRINQHPYEAPEEAQLRNNLLEEYYRILTSLR